jgi:excisionase family DNA binding protein
MTESGGSHRPTLVTYAQAAQRLAVSQMTIRRLVERGKLDAVRIGGAVRLTSNSVDAIAEGKGVRNAQ